MKNLIILIAMFFILSCNEVEQLECNKCWDEPLTETQQCYRMEQSTNTWYHYFEDCEEANYIAGTYIDAFEADPDRPLTCIEKDTE